MAIAGNVFSNVTLYVQNVTTHFLDLVNGMTYYVSVRATSGGAQRLSSIASSAPVKVLHCMQHLGHHSTCTISACDLQMILVTAMNLDWLSSVFGL